MPTAPKPAVAGPRFTRAKRLLGLLLLILAPPHPVHAQSGAGTVWVSLDDRPAGTPAQVVLNLDLSGPSETWIDVTISGLYATTRVGADGRIYQDLSVPGLPSLDLPGEPRVPVLRAELGIVTDASGASLGSVSLFDVRTLSGFIVWPASIPALIHDGTPAQFVRDSATYASSADFPPGDGLGGATRATLGGIPAALCTAYPVHWNPVSGVLRVAARARFGFTHGGITSTPMSLTSDHARLAAAALLNWASVGSGYAVNWNQFLGAYLFICPSAWMPQLQPLIQEKKTRGFAVSVRNQPLTGETCAQLQQTIRDWYSATRPGDDHYCLLVGSFGSAPPCSTQSGILTDKLLSSVDSDFEPEIFFGRLFVANAAELQNQVQKILDYEIGAQVNHDRNVLLVAHHQQDQDFDFESYQQAVRTAPYAQVTPGFITCYGTNPALGNANLSTGIENGVGLVAYFGHGGTDRWWHWSFANASYATSDALALNNGALTPVVWSHACETADLRQGSNLASGFMKNTHGGAVAFYGAVEDIYGSITTVLEDSLFQEVYGEGITRHAQAIALAEHAMVMADSVYGFDAATKYVLYGDPEMGIKRHNPGGVWAPLDLLAPSYLVAQCPGSGCCPGCPGPTLDVQVRDASGAPLPGVRVGAWKIAAGGGDELLDNRYTDIDGWVHIATQQLTAGTILYGWDDGDGRAGMDSIEVRPTTSVSGAGSRPFHLVAIPNVTSGAARLEFGRTLAEPARVRLIGADGRLIRSLEAPAGALSLEWDGRDLSARAAMPGLYFVELRTGSFSARTRIVVVR